MVFILENISLLQLIVLYNFFLVRWFYKSIIPITTLQFLLYITMLDSLSKDSTCAENMFQILFLSIYLAFLIVLLAISVADKNPYSILLCIVMFSYFDMIGKLDIYSVSLAFFSCFWYNKLGVYLFKKVMDYFFFCYENCFFEKKLFLMAKLVYWSITVLYKVALFEIGLKNRIFKRIFFSVCIWVSIYYFKSIALFIAINVFLNILLLINSSLIFLLHNSYFIITIYNQLTKEEYVSIYEKLYALSYLETDARTKKRINKCSLILCAFEVNLVTVVKPLLARFPLNTGETTEFKLFLKFFQSITNRKEYHNLAHDEMLLKLESYVSSNLSQEETVESNTFRLLKQLEFVKEKLLVYHQWESNINDYPTKTSSLLLVVKTPIWYININFPLIKIYGSI